MGEVNQRGVFFFFFCLHNDSEGRANETSRCAVSFMEYTLDLCFSSCDVYAFGNHLTYLWWSCFLDRVFLQVVAVCLRFRGGVVRNEVWQQGVGSTV